MWNNVFNPYVQKYVVENPIGSTPEPATIVSVQVDKVVDGDATVVVTFDDGTSAAFLLAVGGLNQEEASRYLSGLDSEDLVELLSISDENEAEDD